jgi:hypothetical protein
MLEAKTRFTERVVTAKGHHYTQMVLYVPKDLVKDSQFPFKAGQDLTMRIEGGRVILEKA